MFVSAQIFFLIDGISTIRARHLPPSRWKTETLQVVITEPMKRAKRQTSRAEYRPSDTVKTVRGEGVIKFVFPRARNGKIAYSVNFANKRLGIIFHENELAPCLSRGHT